MSKTELRRVLRKASIDETYLLKNNDARLGSDSEFSYSELSELLEQFGQTFIETEDLIDYCIDMEFDIEPGQHDNA